MIVLQSALIRRNKGDTLSLLEHNSYLSPRYLVLSLLLPYYFLDYLGWLLLVGCYWTNPLYSIFFLVLPKFPRFSTWRLQLVFVCVCLCVCVCVCVFVCVCLCVCVCVCIY